MHSFHIPVLGLGFSVDTPLKVAQYGISSVASIVDDELTERMRGFYAAQQGLPFTFIAKTEPDYRARRIEAYLNLMHDIVERQFEQLRSQEPGTGSNFDRFFALLPMSNPLKIQYMHVLHSKDRAAAQQQLQTLRSRMQPGRIDVNIMSKVDKMNYDEDGNPLGDHFTDALSGLRGFAQSKLKGAVVLSAGMSPRLYSYLEHFACFYPNQQGEVDKKIILKVSDYRSALIQAKFLAKKGLWVDEFRIESGLNCGGHAFATDGLLLGPILEEFKLNRQKMHDELCAMYNAALLAKEYATIPARAIRITVQGGIGTAAEDNFLRQHYQVDGTGWGSPFLLVPEATNVDEATLQKLTAASADDFYLSGVSPLGVLFNNFRGSSMEQLRLQRIARNRPGSPCTKKYLCTNTEFTDQPICTASREYQHKKIMELQGEGFTPAEYSRHLQQIIEKTCLCEGLATSAYIKNGLLKPKESDAVAICPGPNLAYFKRTYTLDEMADHIYGRINLLHKVSRSHMFVNELRLYISYVVAEVERDAGHADIKRQRYLQKFITQLKQGVAYYKELLFALSAGNTAAFTIIGNELDEALTLIQQTEAQWGGVKTAI